MCYHLRVKYGIDPYYETPEWRLLRRQTLQRDHHACRYCGDRAQQADHVIPRSKGGPDHLNNLVACCRHCNKIAGGSVFPSFDAKRSWILKSRGKTPVETPPRTVRHQKAPTVRVRKLSGLRLRLASKHRPDHVIEAQLLAKLLQKSQS